MLRPRWRKVFSDLWDNKSRSLLVILSITVGVFSVGMIAGAYWIISNDMSASYSGSSPANVQLWADEFDEDFVNSVRRVPGVKEAEGRRVMSVRVRNASEQWVRLDLVANADFAESAINTLLPVSGELFPADRQLTLDRSALKKIPAAAGDRLEIQLPDNTLKEVPVAGIVRDQSTAAGDFLAAPLGFITFDTLEWLQQPESFNRLYITVEGDSNDEAHIRRVSAAVQDKLQSSGRQVYRTEHSKTNEHPMQATVQAILGVLGALGVLILFLSSSLITNTLNALLAQHVRFIGVMKLVGARSYQISIMYITLIVVFGLVALLISIPLGGQAAYALAQMIASELNFSLLGYRLVPAALAIQAGVALLVPLAAGFFPINTGSRITVQKAISGYTAPQTEGESGWLEQAGGRSRLSRPLLLSLRNTFRRKGRLALTLLTLTMGGAIFIAVFNVRLSMDKYIASIQNYFLADVNLNFDRPYRLTRVEQYALQVPGVKSVEGWAYTGAEVLRADGTVARNLQILAPPAASPLVKPILRPGSRWVQPGEGNTLAISEAILETFPDLKTGDRLRLKIGGREADWTVVGIFRFVGSQSMLAYADYEVISRLVNLPRQAFTYRIVTEQHSRAYQTQISAEIDRFFRQNGFHVSEAEPGGSVMDAAAEGLEVLITFLLIMALLTAMVGSMGLTGTMSMNVLERTREIGIMRSIGAVDREVVKSVIVEGVLIGLISWLLGSLLSFPISTLLATIIGLAIFQTPLTLVFSLQGFAIWLVLVLILSALASILPARNAARLTIREVLAYE